MGDQLWWHDSFEALAGLLGRAGGCSFPYTDCHWHVSGGNWSRSRSGYPQSENALGRSFWREVKAGSDAFFDEETARKPRAFAVKGGFQWQFDHWVKDEMARVVVPSL